ncbi:VOC family protein [Actinopolymorpha rutila]|uniref:Putative enzyme related to lactoylglutathione lyase n=1 Tax=Actinopolymorpha rutila TaxID=446787 RepID=A0A852Z7A1_9ACTN|nr:VOC family protein [Actinopolymorpha rutila]NYH87752.1 putative enzyme related to lactoylglutathione lyase [Actinopolymorpha rutila]
MAISIQCVVVDAADPDRLAAFWEAALGWRRTYDSPDQIALEPPAGSIWDGVAPDLLFVRVLDARAGKNRLHLDLRPEDQAAEVARLESLGASRASVGQAADAEWMVMTDPEGNEFCVLQAFTAEQNAELARIRAARTPATE